MALPKIVLKNQFGEESINNVLPGGTTLPGLEPIAAHTVLMNNTGASAIASAVVVQSVANALPSKAGITAISALAGGATLSDVITQVNAILAALKVVS